MKILIVDDDDDIQNMYREILAKNGYDSKSASSGAEGLALLEKEVFNFIILDLHMTGMDGMQTLDGIKERKPMIPVCILSAYINDYENKINAAFKKGYEFMVKEKPLPTSDLLNMLEKYS